MRKFMPTGVDCFVLIIVNGLPEPFVSDKCITETVHVFFMETENSVHIGSIIRQKLQEQGRSAAWLAKQIPCTRNNVFKIMRKPHISTDLLLRISKILDYNFFSCFDYQAEENPLLNPKMDSKCNP